MKSYHDYKGEYRAARKRWRRGAVGSWTPMLEAAGRLICAHRKAEVVVCGTMETQMLADVLCSGGRLVMVPPEYHEAAKRASAAAIRTHDDFLKHLYRFGDG